MVVRVLYSNRTYRMNLSIIEMGFIGMIYKLWSG